MNNEKFKIRDRVRIINCSMIEPYELNKVGTIVDIQSYEENDYRIYVVNMGRPRRSREPDNTCWYLQEKYIELVSVKNEQLLFNFMLEG